ncbi:MAG: regulatory protein RecX [Candidatus Omnitrophota bacterium]
MKSPACSSEEKKARDIVFRLLKIRPRSEAEIRERLRLKEVSDTLSEKTIEYFLKSDLLNDRRFTRMWIASRLAKPLGLRRISQELKRKGIAAELIQEEMKAISADYALSEESVVLSLAQRRFQKYKTVDRQKARRRICEYLARRGFNISAISKAVRDL